MFISSIEKTLQEMKKDIIIIKNDCNKMCNHINFVDNVYSKVKIPFNFLCAKANILCKDDQDDQDDYQLKIMDKV